MRTYRWLLLITITGLALPAHGQAPQDKGIDPTSYKVEYRIHDGADTSPAATRQYILMLDGNGRGSFRVGQKVPYATGIATPGSKQQVPINYVDSGVNIDCRLRLVNGRVTLHSDVEMSAVVSSDRTVPLAPAVASTRITAESSINPGQPLLVASINDPSTKRKLLIESVVTKID